jgi:hypothetical protein
VLSQIQVRSILESVARTHLAKMDRLAVMETADGVSADEGRSSDRVVGWARRLQAVQGASATVHDAERRMLAENGLRRSARPADSVHSPSHGLQTPRICHCGPNVMFQIRSRRCDGGSNKGSFEHC